MKAQLLFVAAGVLVATAQAQNNALGHTAGFDVSYTDRIGANNVEADGLLHFDTRDYRDWMLDPADPTGATMTFISCRVIVQDQIGNTPDMFTMVGYTEDPLVPDFPNPAATWFRTGQINLPASTLTTPVAWIYTIPVTVPAVPKGDAWIGVGMFAPPGGVWPTDGLSTHVAYDRPATFLGPPNRDLPGQGIVGMPVPNMGCWIPATAGVPTGPATYPATGRRQIWLELTANVASGVPVTQTNQTIYPSSNPGGANVRVPLGGTTNMISGLNPDVYDFNAQTPPRNDDIGFVVQDVSVPNAPIFVLLSFGYSPVGSQPLSGLMGGSSSTATKGNVCIDFTQAATFFGLSNATGVFQMMLPMSPATRLAYQGLFPIDLVYQAFVLNTAAAGPGITIHGTGCGTQHL